jgi:3-phosphoinositide dependent protein kinase-1
MSAADSTSSNINHNNGNDEEEKEQIEDGTSKQQQQQQQQQQQALSSSLEDLRQQGNFQFRQGHFDVAVQLYSLAIEHAQETATAVPAAARISEDDDDTTTATTTKIRQQQLVVNLCNRSTCYFKMQEYELAKQDATQALQLDPNNLKAEYRLATTLVALQDFGEAKTMLQAALTRIERISQQQQQEESANHDTQQPSLSEQKKAFEELLKHCQQTASSETVVSPKVVEHSIKLVNRPISIKEFIKGSSLGSGNFTEVIVVTHARTNERFALKMIEKKQAADLAKRQHPNVWNEIQMERRVLLERLPQDNQHWCPYIIRMYHVFQDYNSWYYLMDVHDQWGDLWSELRVASFLSETTSDSCDTGQSTITGSPPPKAITRYMVGAHPSQSKIWMYELVSALEHLHKHGIVHRDLKPENILLNRHGHVIVMDFGTAKDLIQTDLNGPEFVGTPDFMSPESVGGNSDDDHDAGDNDGIGAVHTSDLWALGAILFILHTGHTPFWCPSPYLAFLKIKRCNLMRAPGIENDDCWDLITKLMNRDPTKRIGADAFQVRRTSLMRSIVAKEGGYDEIRNHPYFDSVRNNSRILEKTPVPSLRDLCIRAVAELAFKDSLDFELCDKHPPGDGSSHDIMRLKPVERAEVMHVLERMRLLREPRLYARFFVDQFACRLDKVRTLSHDFVGLTQMTDDQAKAPKAVMNDPYATPVDLGATQIVHLVSPLFVRKLNEDCSNETRKEWIKLLKKSISVVNRRRPKLCITTGYIDEKCRKLLSRISETIPVVCHDGSTFFSFWLLGVQCIAIQSTEEAVGETSSQMRYLREQLEQCRMSKHPLFVFVDTDARNLPKIFQKRLARGRALGIFGISNDEDFTRKVSYEANTIVDDHSVKSTSSDEDDKDEFTMNVYGTRQNSLRWLTVNDEPGDWKDELDLVNSEDVVSPVPDVTSSSQGPIEF